MGGQNSWAHPPSADRVTQASPRAARASRPSVSTALRGALHNPLGLGFIALLAGLVLWS